MDSAGITKMKVDQNKRNLWSISTILIPTPDIIKTTLKWLSWNHWKFLLLVKASEIPYAEKLPITQEFSAFVNQTCIPHQETFPLLVD